MPRFAFQAVNAAGKPVRGFESALDLSELDRRLAASELLLVEAQPARPRRRPRATGRALIDFCYHLSIVLQAGVPLLRGLADLRDQDGSPLAEALADVTRRVESGSTLSEALAERPQEFPRLVRALVRAGETTGRLDSILVDLVRYLEWREDLARQLKSAATYPAIVVLGVVALVAIVMGFVLPSFLEIFADLSVELPLSTRALIALRAFLAGWWAPLCLGSAGIAAGLLLYTRTERGQSQRDRALLRVPILGRLLLMVEASRFSHNLGILYSAGLPIVASLELVRDIVQNRRVRAMIEDVRERVARGETLTDALGRHSLMPGIVLRMVAIGESTGKLDESLERAAVFYDREVPEIVKRFLALFNLGALLFLGSALVLVALSLFVPLYRMLGNINGET